MPIDVVESCSFIAIFCEFYNACIYHKLIFRNEKLLEVWFDIPCWLSEEIFMERLSIAGSDTLWSCRHRVIAFCVSFIGNFVFCCIKIFNFTLVADFITLELFEPGFLKVACCLNLKVTKWKRSDSDHIFVHCLIRWCVRDLYQIVDCCELDVLKLCKVRYVENGRTMDSNQWLWISFFKVDTELVEDFFGAPEFDITEKGFLQLALQGPYIEFKVVWEGNNVIFAQREVCGMRLAECVEFD